MIGKMVTGVGNLKAETSMQDRKKYYKPFLAEKKNLVQIRHYNQNDSLINGWRRLSGQNIPILLIHNVKTDKYYSLSCYEDIEGDVEAINNKNFSELVEADSTRIKLVADYMQETIAFKELSADYQPDNSNELEAFYVGGIWTGKKLRKRVQPITEIENLRSIYLIELSKLEASK
ncbi:hypothetical protein BST97_00240 [Nonlabens spongiae]|uniref:Uncharacterized protein n=1 Tax=Nonlabens spongiae TaxID=331648 RepID=A0A1W6MGB6_9FLAO|nr:hypothetical protein [Nonlabens spongiae]ARN76556.1 hypothetical protein BST97_00240 [Nonlabens spongiae]